MPAQPAGAGLFDESALPDWLRAAATGSPYDAPQAPWQPSMGQGAMPGGAPGGWAGTPAGASMNAGPIGAFAPQQPAGMFQPQQPPQTTQGDRMAAQSLLDASSLPSWLGGPNESQAQAAPAMPLGGDGLSANTLVDERALPLWLRQEPVTPTVEGPPAGSISQWLSGPITDEPLPAWLNQVYAQAQVPRMQVSQPIPAPFANAPAEAAAPIGAMPVSQLVDDSALPDWLRAQAGPSLSPAGGMPYTPPSSVPGAGFGGQPGGSAYAFGMPDSSGPSAFGGNGSGAFSGLSGDPGGPADWSPAAQATIAAPGADAAAGAFSASDLIDPSVLPSWVQQGSEVAAEPVFSSTQGWTSKQASIMPGQSPADAGIGGDWGYGGGASGMAAGLEANLPPWLAGAGAGAGAGGPMLSGPAEMATGLTGTSGRRPAQGAIPDAELPPWLRGQGPGASRGDRSNGWPGGGARGWDGQQGYTGARAAAGRNHPAPEPGAGEEFSDFWDDRQAPPAGQPMGLYADRYGEERPGAAGRFSYEYDHGQGYGGGEAAATAGQQDGEWGEPTKTGKRKRWFGRR